MRRFTTTVVARRTLATSAMHVGSRTAPFAAEFDGRNENVTRASPRASAPDVQGLPLEARVAKLEASLTTMATEYNVMIMEEAALVERYHLWQAVVTRLRKVSTFDLTTEVKCLDLVAQALQFVDEDFQRRYNTRYSLLRIWLTPYDRRDDEAATALRGFLDANAQWLSSPVRMYFFLAWERVRERCNVRVLRSTEGVRQLQREDVKVALDVCCERFDEDVRATLLEVILQSIEKA